MTVLDIYEKNKKSFIVNFDTITFYFYGLKFTMAMNMNVNDMNLLNWIYALE